MWLCLCTAASLPNVCGFLLCPHHMLISSVLPYCDVASSATTLLGLVSLPFRPHIQVQLGLATISKSNWLLLLTLIDHTSIINPNFLDSDIKNRLFFGLNAYHSTISEHIACFHQNYNSKSCVWISLGVKVWAGCVGSKEGWFSGAMVWWWCFMMLL